MHPLQTLKRLRLAGRLCRYSAWAILIGGGIADFYLFFLSFSNGNQNSGAFWSLVAGFALVMIPVFFFFIFLYSIGAVLDYFASRHTIAEIAPLRHDVMEDQIVIRNLPRQS
jgi:hypothetical protein